MAWNQPGGNGQDPWGGGNRGGDGGPPDLDEALRKMQDKLNNLFGGKTGGGGGRSGGGFSWGLFGLIAAVLFLIWLGAGIYQVNEQERALVLRFGVFNTIKGPGLHWNPPLVDDVYIENTTRLRTHTTNGLMLTEDENIVQVELSVQYNVADIKNFLLEVNAPERSLREATDSALRHVIGSSEMHEVLTEGREQIAIDVQQRLQTYLDNYQTGIQVNKVNIEESQPPREVQAAFDDVIKAREDEARFKNEAETYANGIIPEARGEAQRMIEEANGYRDQVIARAEGEAERFEKLLAEYRKAPEVTRERLYIEAVQQVLENTSKVVIDVEDGNNLLYLPLDKIMQHRESASTAGGRISTDVIKEISNRVSEELGQRSQTTRNSSRGVR